MTGQIVQLAMWVGLSTMGAGSEVVSRVPVLEDAIDAPWTQVSREEQEKGLALFYRANQAVHDSDMKNAEGLYRQALDHWDHPAFHYNLAIALLVLSNTLEGHEHLQAAIRYGPEPLNDREKYRNARKVLEEVEDQLVRLEFTCMERGAQVTVDARDAPFSCPGSYAQWTQPGIHVVKATKSGFYPTTKNLNLRPGERRLLPLRLYTEAQWTRTRTRWPAWMPWAVMGGGVSAVGLGGGLYAYAGDRYRAYDKLVRECTNAPEDDISFPACSVTDEMTGLLAAADVIQGFAWGLYVSGVVVLGTASVLVSLNFPQPYLVDPESEIAPESKPTVAIGPMLMSGARGVMLMVNF